MGFESRRLEGFGGSGGGAAPSPFADFETGSSGFSFDLSFADPVVSEKFQNLKSNYSTRVYCIRICSSQAAITNYV